MLLGSIILSPRHLCPNQTPSIEMIMWCKCDAAQAAEKAIEFVNPHSKMLLPSVDFFRLCHRTVMLLSIPSCVPWRVSCWNLWGQGLKLLTIGYQLHPCAGWLWPKGIQVPQSYSVIYRCWVGVCKLTAVAIRDSLLHLVLFAREQQRNCSTASSP